MKNMVKLFGFIALVAIIGFSMTACGGDDDDGGSSGGLTITDIPSDHNGKYAMFSGTSSGGTVLGCQSINTSTGVVTLVKITNGKVSLPTLTGTGGDYSGSHSVTGTFFIGTTTSQTFDLNNTPTPSATRSFTITFSNGNATVSWNQGT